MPEDMPEDMPDRMPDRMPEDMSGRMPEDLPISKCINVMVGITRSKVFFCKCPSVFCTFPAFPEFLPGNCKFAKKKMRKKNAKKVQTNCDSTIQQNIAANPMQANEKCKSTPNIKSLAKKCKSDMQHYRKKMQNTIHFQHPSLYQTNCHNPS
jgi:hypothetical protein